MTDLAAMADAEEFVRRYGKIAEESSLSSLLYAYGAHVRAQHKADERLVTVCSACLTAACWHGEHMCCRSAESDTVRVPAIDLDRLAREHPGNYSEEKIREVTGGR